MRIVVNDIAASSGGALTVLKSFYNHIKSSENAMQHEWIFLLSEDFIDETENIKVIVLKDIKKSWINRLNFDFIYGRRFIANLKPDIVFSLQNTITYGIECPQVVYAHQAIPFQRVKKFSIFNKRERRLAIYQYIIGAIIKESIKRANKTIVQTKWIKDAVIKSTNISADRINNIFPKQDDLSSYKKDGVFNSISFFYPATNELYKNHDCIFKACKILNSKGVKEFEIKLTIEEESTISNVVSVGVKQFEEVLEEYNYSTLIFPSYIETMGLPLIEARQMGTIILASDCPFSREVLDGYENAYFFDPFEPSQLAVLIQRVIENDIVKHQVSSIGVNTDGWESVIGVLNEVGDN